MPTYDYQCAACGHAWEMVQPMTASPVKVCPACGKRQAKRLIGTGAALLFKGSGFYQTDYRTESYKKGAEAESKAVSGDSAKPAAGGGPGAGGGTGAGGATSGAAGSATSGGASSDGSAKAAAAGAQAAVKSGDKAAKPAAKGEGKGKSKK